MTCFRFFVVGAILPAALISQPIMAQQIDPVDVYQDPHGVDLVSNNVSTPKMPELSIPAAPELTFRDLADFVPLLEIVTGDNAVAYEPNTHLVSAGRVASDLFAQCGPDTCYASNGTGGVLFGIIGGGGNSNIPPMCDGPACPPPETEPYVSEPGDTVEQSNITYRAGGSGKKMTFDLETGRASGTLPQPVKKYLARKIILGDGLYLDFQYETKWIGGQEFHRPSVVTGASGYQLSFTYYSNSNDQDWGVLKKVAIAEISSPNVILASLSYAGNTVTDQSGQVYRCVCMPSIYPTRPEHLGSSMMLPGETNYSFRTFRQDGTHIRTVTADGVEYTYVSTPDNSWPRPLGSPWPIRAIHDLTITGPDGFYQFINVTNLQATTGEFDPPRRRVDSVTDALGRTTIYHYTPNQRLRGVTYPDGNKVTVYFDERGNLVGRTDTPKPSSSSQSIGQSASFPSTNCGILGFNCYRPEWIEDGKGNRTDFTWNWWGQLVTQVAPPDQRNRRQKTINVWSDEDPINGEQCARFLDEIGQLGPPKCMPRLLSSEICETDADGVELNCGTSDAIVTSYTYFNATALPVSEKVTSGGETLLICRSYDAAGRLISETSPRADLQVCP